MLEIEDPPAAVDIATDLSTEHGSGEKFISFEIGDKLFCVAAVAVQEVVQPIAPASVPLSPLWLLGLGSFKGEPVALINPSTIAGAFRSQPNVKPKTIVFRSLPNNTQFALPIDSLREMITVDPSFLRSGEFVHGGRPVTLVDHDQLFNSFDGNTAQR